MNYKLIKSGRKTLAMEINLSGEIIVRSPENCSQKVIDNFVNDHEKWAERNLAKLRQRQNKVEKYAVPPEKENEYRVAAEEYIPQRVAYWSKIMHITPTNVKITSAKKRFGSCSGKNSLCFSLRLMAYDRREIDYVIVHELSHIKYKNHSSEFYAFIEKYLPTYRESEKILRQGD